MAHLTDKPWIDGSKLNFLLDRFAYELYSTYNGSVCLDIAIFGGCAMIVKHPNFRESTVDIDTYITVRSGSSFNTKKFIEQFATKYSCYKDWMNEDVIKSPSFSVRIVSKLKFYTLLYNCCNIYIVGDEEQLSMKAIAGRPKDKNDIMALCLALRQVGYTYDDFLLNLQTYFGRDETDIKGSVQILIKRELKMR